MLIFYLIFLIHWHCPTAPAVAEDDTNIAFGSSIHIADTDGDSQSVTLTATNGTLSMGGGSSTDFTTGDGEDDVVIAFNDALFGVNLVLDSLTFTPTANFSGTAKLRMQTDDGNGGTDDDTLSFAVSAVNDAPTITGVPPTTIAEDSVYSFTPTVTDIDAGDTKTFSITNQPSWATFSNSTGHLTGTPINANVGTTSNIVITVTDGTASTSLASFNLVVTNTNDAPTSSDNSFTIDEDTSKTFVSSDFTFIDDDTIHGDALDSIVITSLETAGSLKLNGADVTLNQKINVSDISNLVFIPVVDTYGSPYATFGFKVNDGEANSISTYTTTINVTAGVDTIAMEKISAYATLNTNPIPTIQDYLDAGVTGVDANNLNSVNAGVDATDTNGVDTLAKVQLIATTANTALLKVQAYANDNTATLPTVQDYIDAGVTGVDEDNLNAVNAGVDATDSTGVDSVAKIQTIATTGNTTADTAMTKIATYATDGLTAPSVQDYEDAGITGVDEDNLNAVNAGVDATDSTGVDSVAKIQIIATTGNTTADTAITKITAYATDGLTAPSVQDYVDAGVIGVDEDNLNAVNAGVDATDSTGVDSVAKIQTIATTGNTTADTAITKITAYATDGLTAPSVQDYEDAGITGVDEDNLNAVNAGIDATDSTGVDSVAKIQTIATTGNTTADNAMSVVQAYANDNTATLPTVQDYIDAGVTGVDEDNLNAVNAGVDASDTTNTLADIQA